jgi:hypothetical protein
MKFAPMLATAALAAATLVTAALAAPAHAQPVTAVAVSPEAPVDAQRLALARQAASALWPDGTYSRMMKGSMDQMMDAVMGSMMDVKVSDMVPVDAKANVETGVGNATMREVMQKSDPAFQERMRITNHVIMEEMAAIFSKFEPELREGLAQAYARKFDAAQLAEMDRFFATPAGRVYAGEAMVTMMDPQVMTRITKAMPEMMQAMPRIMEKVQKATAHLPPLPSQQKATAAKR